MKDILVIGDSCRDIFVYCDATRLCPEAPVPVLNVLDQTENAGMAKNVYRNIRSLTTSCDIITNPNWTNITKTRYVHHESNHMFFRVDVDQPIDRIDLRNINFADYKCVVVSDYNKGFLSESDISSICSSHPRVIVDSKKVIDNWAEYARVIKINDSEYKRSNQMLNHIRDKVIHTIGSGGCIYKNIQYKVDKVEVRDVSGAGDSFLAALAYEYVRTDVIEDAIIFANKCASEVVKHKGVTTI